MFRFSEFVGEFGLFQLLTFSVLSLSITTHSLQMLANKWLTYDTPHWCARPRHLRETLTVVCTVHVFQKSRREKKKSGSAIT